MNDAKKPTQVQDTVSFLGITYSFLDTTSELSVTFHPSVKPSLKNTWKLSWDFGDSTGVFGRNDTNDINHIFKKSGGHSITLSVTDTVRKYLVGKTTILLGLEGALTQLAIIYSVPDSDHILIGQFTSSPILAYQKNLRLDWNFGDSSGIISRFDTNNFLHSFKTFGTYNVILTVVDTNTKIVLGRASLSIDIKDNSIDTNFLHQFSYIDIFFTLIDSQYYFPSGHSLCYLSKRIIWDGNFFYVNDTCGWSTGSYQTWNLDQGEILVELNGHISYSGRKINSGSYNYFFHDFEAPRAGFVYISKGTILNYENLPLYQTNSNESNYSFSGPNLKNKITQFRDSSSYQLNTYTPNTHTLFYPDIQWSQQPPILLQIIFSK